ncbi:MAG: sigma-70 family RNA polymerase sigma factor [Roseovarius sp.]|nr:sigma-70 family RNA polymerase sigma factor [Roseovarius sp.]
MFAEPKHTTTEVSRQDAEAKLIEYRNKFLGFLRKRLNSPQDAEDVFQDFCVKVLHNHSSIRSVERLDAWLGITLQHALTDHYRRQATRNRGAEAYANDVNVLEPEAGVYYDPVCSCISAAMQKLEPSQAELLTRLDLRDEPRKMVAAELEVSLNTLGVRVHRIRAILKKKITEICPVCGEGGFMQCDCDHSRTMLSLSPAPQPGLAAVD